MATLRRRFLRFSLRTLFVVVTVAAVEAGFYNLASGYREPMLALSILCLIVAVVAYSFVGPWRGFKTRPTRKARTLANNDSPAPQPDRP